MNQFYLARNIKKFTESRFSNQGWRQGATSAPVGMFKMIFSEISGIYKTLKTVFQPYPLKNQPPIGNFLAPPLFQVIPTSLTLQQSSKWKLQKPFETRPLTRNSVTRLISYRRVFSKVPETLLNYIFPQGRWQVTFDISHRRKAILLLSFVGSHDSIRTRATLQIFVYFL